MDGMQACANTACGRELSAVVLRCGRCKSASYCSKECQILDWKTRHKQTCVRAASAITGVKRGDQLNRLFNDGAHHYEGSRFPQAIAAFQAVKALAEEVENPGAVMNALINLGACYYAQGVRIKSQSGKEQKEAIRLYLEAGAIAERLGIRQEQMKICGSLGACYALLKQYEESKQSYQKALDIANEIGDSYWKDKAQIGLSKCYFGLRVEQMTASINLGDHFLNRNHYQKAIEIYKDGKIVAQEIGDHETCVKACIGLGACYSALEQHDRALAESTEYETLAEARGCPKMQMTAYTLSGYSYYRLEQYTAAIQRYERGKAIAEQLGDHEEVSRLLGEITRCSGLLQMGSDSAHRTTALATLPENAQSASRKTKKKKKKKDKTPTVACIEYLPKNLSSALEENLSSGSHSGGLETRSGNDLPTETPVSPSARVLPSWTSDDRSGQGDQDRAEDDEPGAGAGVRGMAGACEGRAAAQGPSGQDQPVTEEPECQAEKVCLPAGEDASCQETVSVRQELADLKMQLFAQKLKHAEVLEKFENELQKMRHELNVMQEEQAAKSECVVCLEASSHLVALLPCGHLCSCPNCARFLMQCPLCCAPVAHVARIFT